MSKFEIEPNEIRRIHKHGNLAIFVGAGVSSGCGLPNWKDLIDSIAERIWKYKKPTISKKAIDFIKTQSITDIARLARNEVGSDLNRIIAETLYIDKEIKISDTILSIVNSGIRHICTLNYDDLIEEGFGLEMRNYQSVVNGENFNIHNPSPIIYHPHGYLPRWGNHNEYKEHCVVLSDDDYNTMYSNPLSWANTIQTSLLVTKSVLFVGMSMQDPNLKRLLKLTKSIGCNHNHYAILPSPHLTLRGLEPNSNNQIKQTISCDMLSSNVKIHWINNYNEIPEYIKNITQEK
jgi:hypothetical protein